MKLICALVEPKILYQGDWIRFAFRTVDGSGVCPNKDEVLDAFCRKLGFSKHTTSRTYVLKYAFEASLILGA